MQIATAIAKDNAASAVAVKEATEEEEMLAEAVKHMQLVNNSSFVPLCMFCEALPAEMICQDCPSFMCLCERCFEAKHKKSPLSEHNHRRVASAANIVVCAKHGYVCEQYCMDCSVFMCKDCCGGNKLAGGAAAAALKPLKIYNKHATHNVLDTNTALDECKRTLQELLGSLAAKVDSQPVKDTASATIAALHSQTVKQSTQQIEAHFDAVQKFLFDTLAARKQTLVEQATLLIDERTSELRILTGTVQAEPP